MMNQRWRSPVAAVFVLGLAHCSEQQGAEPLPQMEPENPTLNDPAGDDTSEVEGAPAMPPGDTGDGSLPMPPGGQTGDDNGSSALACDRITITSLPLDQPTPLGFTPEAVLELAIGSTTLPLRWLSPVLGPEGELLDHATRVSSDVALRVELLGNEARLVERFDTETGTRCPDSVQADVVATLSSADGALAEQLDAVVELRAGMASVSGVLPAATLAGTFEFDPAEYEGRAPSELRIDVNFTRYGQSGDIAQIYGPPENTRWRAIAEWPGGLDCESRGVTPVLDEQRSPTVEDLLEMVRGPSSMVLRNTRGENAPVALVISGLPQAACFAPAPFGQYVEAEQLDQLLISAEVSLTSTALPAPIRLPLHLFGSFEASAGAFDVVGLSLFSQPCGTGGIYSPAEFIEHCGDWGLDLRAYTSVSLDIPQSNFGAASHFAVFQVRGDTYPGCTPGPLGYTCEGNGDSTRTSVIAGEVRIFAE